MPREAFIDPAVVRRRGRLVTPDIPVNAYLRDMELELATRGRERLVRMLRDMHLIRAFESMLDTFKRLGRFEETSYAHHGAAHLSIGQEAVAVGQAAELRVEDHIFGSHRSHGEVLAKGLAAIDELDERALEVAMSDPAGRGALAVVDAHLPTSESRLRATRFLLYGLLAEIFGRRTGFDGGLGGSMHAFFTPFGIYPNNAIVGGSAPIAAGAALYRRVRARSGIVVANIGDGSSAAGPVWEALNFAAMRQLSTLWGEGHRGGLPILFFFVDNFYAMGGQTGSETMAYDRLARIGAGLNDVALHAQTVDGNDPLAVADAVGRARAMLLAGDGPVLLDVLCYRQSGHSPSDASSYRTRAEVEAWRAVDPITEFGDALEQAGIIDPGGRVELELWASERISEVVPLSVDTDLSPRPDLVGDPDAIARLTFAGTEDPDTPTETPDLSIPLAKSSRLSEIAKRSRSGLGENGERLPASAAVTLRLALFEAIAEAAANDPELVIYGQEARDWGGAFGVYRGLTEMLPYHRLFNAPISEAAIVGTAVGYAMAGGRALIELMYADFIGRAGDELLNQLAKWRAMSGGTLRLPVVVRVSVGSRYGAQHSQDWSGLVAGVPGLKVVYPATPYDAKGLLASALRGSDPVVFFEAQSLYDTTELWHAGGVPRDPYRIPIGTPDIKRAGRDLTVVAVGPALHRALAAAERLRRESGIEAEVIDARSLVPFDLEPVLGSVRRTNRLLFVSDAVSRASPFNALAVSIGRLAFGDLAAAVVAMGAPDHITPPAEQEDLYLPQVEDILAVVHEELMPSAGSAPRRSLRRDRILEAYRRGA